MTGTDADQEKQTGIIQQEIEDEMKRSYLDYAMSVIVGRALPDIRDGLKPVHRRVLYTMHTTGVLHNKPYRKSANVVGNCMAKFHPHGDSSIYDTLVRMTQNFSLRYMLVDGQGNFGSIDGDNAAAMRYTEARMTRLAEEMMQDIDKETVEFVPNFDNSTKEPSVLPAKAPNLLINGSSGIAVGMATSIPPHNLTEIATAVIAMIDDPNIRTEELMKIVTGPDFPTGGITQGNAGIKQAYLSGRGKVVVRARHHIEERKAGANSIIITEIPYMVNKSTLLEAIADLVKEKKVEGIVDLRDESDRKGMRVVIELKSGANEDVILNLLYKHSRLQDTFSINMLALVDGEPKTLGLREMIFEFIRHRKEVVTRRTQFNLKQAQAKAHILEGLIIALKHIDEVIEKIKRSKDPASAQQVLIKDYDLSEKQAKVILEMRLQRLSAMEQEKIKNDYDDTIKLIQELKAILDDESRIYAIIKQETLELKGRYGDERRTTINEGGDIDIDIEDLIDQENMIVTITHSGYMKRVPLNTYREQGRGGKGIIATGKKEEDFVENIFVANTHDYLLFFTNKGNLHWLKVYKVPQASRQAKGTAIVNLINLGKHERVTTVVPISEFEGKFVVMATKKGTIKKVDARLFSRPRRSGIIAINLEEGDELIKAKLTDGKQVLMIATAKGKAARFLESDVRPTGRTSKGVTSIRLMPNDKVIGMIIADDDRSILTVTRNGYGKQTNAGEYRLIRRGGSGVRNILTSPRNGEVVNVASVSAADEQSLVLISQKGQAIRVPIRCIPLIGRNTQGVRLMRISKDDKIVAAAKVESEADSDIKEQHPEEICEGE